MRRGADGSTWRTSFPLSLPAGAADIIDNAHSVLTILSGSTGTGGHASMILEHFDDQGSPKSTLLDLSAGAAGISINKTPAQILQANGNVINMTLPKGGDWAELTKTHHRCFALTAVQTAALLAAVQRFKDKVSNDRYVYRAPGGVLGRLSSLPGTRGVNCADFIIKVLGEAGITKIGYRLVDTPFRVAK